MIEIQHLRKDYGGVTAVVDVSLHIAKGERHAIIGPNGAGKTTLFKMISGEIMPTRGRVLMDGQDLTPLPVHERTNKGMGHTFQRNTLFSNLSVLENVQLAVQHHRGIASQLWRSVRQFPQIYTEARAILHNVGLIEQAHQLVKQLAYGQQRALEVALALATEPQVLLLDEPTAGMSPTETAEMRYLIAALPRTLTLLLIEHDMDVIFSIADRITVLHYGQVVATGLPQEVRANPTVQETYLGSHVAY